MKKSYRHGDVDIIAVIKPAKLKREVFEGEYVLAYGEVTGHSHRLIGTKDSVNMYRDETGALILNVLGKAVLTHEEHKEIEIAPGWYRVNYEREYNYWGNSTQRVQD